MATIAVDLGTRRVGVAVSLSDSLATPHSVITHLGDLGDVIEQISRIAEETGADRIVVGIPSQGSTERLRLKFTAFADSLRQRTCKEVILWDESFSTVEASRQREASGKSWKSRKREIDMEAAAVILQTYLDEAPGRKS